ncbi:MAG: hypothetical protein M1358_24425 [Chloroflexi bacterium]|nr:hypothetical protein [Chloroflexota bacterium]
MRGLPVLALPAVVAVAAAVVIATAKPSTDWQGYRDPADVFKQDVAVADWPRYSQDIQPIFDRYCVECHGPTRAEEGLRLDSYDGAMKGTHYGPVVIPFEPDFSTLIAQLKHRTARELWMPPGQDLSTNRITNIETWVKLGARNS